MGRNKFGDKKGSHCRQDRRELIYWPTWITFHTYALRTGTLNEKRKLFLKLYYSSWCHKKTLNNTSYHLVIILRHSSSWQLSILLQENIFTTTFSFLETFVSSFTASDTFLITSFILNSSSAGWAAPAWCSAPCSWAAWSRPWGWRPRARTWPARPRGSTGSTRWPARSRWGRPGKVGLWLIRFYQCVFLRISLLLKFLSPWDFFLIFPLI